MGIAEAKIISAKAYIKAVIGWWNTPQGMSDDYEDRRVAAHEAMIDAYNCDPMDLQLITSNLDIWIDLPMDRGNMPDISDSQINQYSIKLHNILESKKFKEYGYIYVCEETKRLRKLWWDK